MDFTFAAGAATADFLAGDDRVARRGGGSSPVPDDDEGPPVAPEASGYVSRPP